ncbi:WD40-repeat-containing domain protein [Panaeolus papilionaceus]|nr:WD40-repeat-containing domain protein [Panaeolus papilionaceus]
MLDSSPVSAPRQVLKETVNVAQTPITKLSWFLPTPPTGKSSTSTARRRKSTQVDATPTKRRKIEVADDSSDESDSEYEDDDLIDIDIPCRPRTDFHRPMYNQSNSAHRPLMHSSKSNTLKTFVSSNKADTYKCHSIQQDESLASVYTCSYSHGAKRDAKPMLALATEQGTVHVVDASKRKDWDSEPQRQVIQAHNNAVFNIKWSPDDSLIATCSGDQTIRMSCPRTGVITHVLKGHTSTVKCVAWDPHHKSILASGGRDGSICIWDLRLSTMSTRPNGDEIRSLQPSITITSAHEDSTPKAPRARTKNIVTPRTVTDVFFSDLNPSQLISSGSFDGVLRCWDLRTPPSKRGRTPKQRRPPMLYSSSLDPTSEGSRRPRGIISLANGTGPSAGLVFAVGADSRIHTYELPSLTPKVQTLQDTQLQAGSFYVGLSVSTCGRWLACGGSGDKGSSFLFDIENAATRPRLQPLKPIELKGHKGEVSAVDWAADSLATCGDDGIVRVWRPEAETYRSCLEDPEEARWNWSWASS